MEEEIPGQEVTQLLVQMVGLALPDTNLSSPNNWTTLTMVTGHLVSTIWVSTNLRLGDHVQIKKDGR